MIDQPPPPRAIPPADLLPVGPRATFAFRLVRAVLTPLIRAVFKVSIIGRERIPRGRYVLVANHLNWLDPFLLLMATPTEPRLHFLANPENLVKNRWHWWLIRQIRGYIPVDLSRHGDTALFEHVDRCLDAGGAVAIFPEAAYGPAEGQLQPTWKAGFAFFAAKVGAPVVPMALSGTKDLWLRKRVSVVIGDPVSTEGRDPRELGQDVRARLLQLLPDYLEPTGRKPLRKVLTKLLY